MVSLRSAHSTELLQIQHDGQISEPGKIPSIPARKNIQLYGISDYWYNLPRLIR
jgi:hypothetical protein